MPLLLAEPIAVSRINHFQITGVHFYLTDDPVCTIEISRGYRDGETVTPVDVITHEVTGAPMQAAMATVTTGQTISEEMETLLYAQCIDDGVIPPAAQPI